MKCPACDVAWDLPETEDGSYLREPLLALVPEIAAHLRTHGLSAQAERMETWATTPTPGAAGNSIS